MNFLLAGIMRGLSLVLGKGSFLAAFVVWLATTVMGRFVLQLAPMSIALYWSNRALNAGLAVLGSTSGGTFGLPSGTVGGYTVLEWANKFDSVIPLTELLAWVQIFSGVFASALSARIAARVAETMSRVAK